MKDGMEMLVKVGQQWIALDEYLNRKYLEECVKAMVFFSVVTALGLLTLAVLWGD